MIPGTGNIIFMQFTVLLCLLIFPLVPLFLIHCASVLSLLTFSLGLPPVCFQSISLPHPLSLPISPAAFYILVRPCSLYPVSCLHSSDQHCHFLLLVVMSCFLCKLCCHTSLCVSLFLIIKKLL